MATASGGGEVYDLFAVDVLDKMADRQWFSDCVADFYGRTAVQWGCNIDVSGRRLGEAHDFWRDDADRTLLLGIDIDARRAPEDYGAISSLDDFKHAAMIAYWLRRLVPINTIRFVADETYPRAVAESSVSTEQSHFSKYGNEMCALFVGFMLCLNHEMQAQEAKRKGGERAQYLAQRPTILREIRLPKRFVYEYPRLLKHKNISWHSVYMTYRSLFEKFVASY